MNWTGAVEFCEWKGGRLPSEAEWEYAARSMGQDKVYPWGEEGPDCDYVVRQEAVPGCGENRTWRVCSRTIGNTEQGLCDMAGNAAEWTADAYHTTYDDAPTDGSPWEDEGVEEKVIRGGSWLTGVGRHRFFRTTYRAGDYPTFRYETNGFRCSR